MSRNKTCIKVSECPESLLLHILSTVEQTFELEIQRIMAWVEKKNQERSTLLKWPKANCEEGDFSF